MDLQFRIAVLDPPRDVVFRLQRGRSELIAPSSETAHTLTFDFPLRVEPGIGDALPRLLGPFVQGPPAKRFVYVCSGRRAGQVASLWDRRAKIHLDGVDASLVAQAASTGAVIETQISGTGRDGGRRERRCRPSAGGGSGCLPFAEETRRRLASRAK